MDPFAIPHFNINLPHYDFTVLGNVLTTIVSVFAIFFIFIISYSVVRIFEIRKKEEEFLHHEIHEFAEHKALHESKAQESLDRSRNPRWNKVLTLVFSDNEADWKLAIIEADSILDTVLDQMGFQGENMGEKLKQIDREKVPSLPSLWEAHAVRNRIAHEGSGFVLSAHEAKRVIALYESIFREFGFI